MRWAVKFGPSVGNRLLVLVGCQTAMAILMVVTAVRAFSSAAADYRHMYGFQVSSIVAIGLAMEEAASLKAGIRSTELEDFYHRYRMEWETASGTTPEAIRFRKDLLKIGETGLPQMETKVVMDLGQALRKGDIPHTQENLATLLDINRRYAELENRAATERLKNARFWLLVIGVAGTVLTWLLGLHVIRAIAPRIRNLVSNVRRFQETGTHERIGDMGKDDIAVLSNAIDAGFSAIASREREREQFLSVAAHELKTPVTTIRGYASLLATAPRDSFDTSRALEVINRQSWRLSRLIEALFLAGRARSGNLQFKPKPLDMSELVGRVLMEMEPFLSKKTFAPRIARNISILGDEALLEHALWCLLTCAVTLSPQNSKVEVALEGNQCASLSVDIHGSDIPMPEVHELFLPFRSLQYETGDGMRSPIGLYLCREIVRVHNGQLYVHSVSELNPEFLMELPI